MKIADVNPFYYPYKGGIERRMHDTAVRLAAEGHEVTVVTGRLSEDDPDEFDHTLGEIVLKIGIVTDRQDIACGRKDRAVL